MKPWYLKTSRQAEVERFERWLEAEYDVIITWDFSPRGAIGNRPRALATAWASPNLWCDVPTGSWASSGELIETQDGAGELKARLRILTLLMNDLQMCRAYGLEECELFVPAAR